MTTYCYSDQQAKPLAEQSLADFDDFFQRCRLTYVFLAYGDGGVNTVYPDTTSAIRLFDGSRGGNYTPFDEQNSSQVMDEDRLQEILSDVRARVAEMDRRTADYCLIWCLPNGGEVHADGCDTVGLDQLASFLAEEVRDHIRGW